MVCVVAAGLAFTFPQLSVAAWIHAGTVPPSAVTVVTMVAGESAKPRFLSKGSVWPGSQTTVSEHMTEKVVTVLPTTTIKEAAMLLNDHRITGAPVTDEEGRLLGVVSRSDFLAAIAAGPTEAGGGVAALQLLDLERAEVGEQMTRDPLTISPNATVLDAAQLMYPNRVNRLMVVNGEGLLLGIISSTDVVRIALCDELSELDYSDIVD
mgnify:CR=1 FL=1